jgi:hypothetical protein
MAPTSSNFPRFFFRKIRVSYEPLLVHMIRSCRSPACLVLPRIDATSRDTADTLPFLVADGDPQLLENFSLQNLNLSPLQGSSSQDSLLHGFTNPYSSSPHYHIHTLVTLMMLSASLTSAFYEFPRIPLIC